MAIYQVIKTDIQHALQDVQRGARKEMVRYAVYIALAIIGAGVVIAFASAAFDALFQNMTS